MDFRKRDDKSPGNDDSKPLCKYSSQCYQRNKDHIEKFRHPPKESEDKVLPPSKKQRVDQSSLKQQNLRSFFRTKASNNLHNKTQSEAGTEEQQINNIGATENTDLNAVECNSDTTVESTSKLESSPEISESNSTRVLRSSSVTDNRENWQKIIKKLFLVDMPPDFFSFWEFCGTISPENCGNALKAIDLELVGPFDVLNGSVTDMESSDACGHWRYFYDPPEFQTVLKSNKSDLLHFGYYRDDPKDSPVFVAYNKAAKDAIINPVGENLFAAVNWCITRSEDTCSPFQKMQLSSLRNKLQKWAKDHSYSLSTSTENMRKRDEKVVAKTFHRAGIVVPYDKKTEVGYRPLAKTATELTKILNQIEKSKTDAQRMIHISELHEVITWANIAVDEGDVGTALELGVDLFCFDSKFFNSMILQLLISAYKLLNRDAFATIIKAHIANRKKGDCLSALKN